jgi:hypothetical protein
MILLAAQGYSFIKYLFTKSFYAAVYFGIRPGHYQQQVNFV